MMHTEGPFARLTITRMASLFRAKEFSPVELVDYYLNRINALNSRLNAFLLVTADKAMSQARNAEREIGSGVDRGPLHGAPISLKDVVYTKGITTTAGSRILADFVPTHDATVWTRLRQAGAVLLGKTNMYEFARAATSEGNSLMAAARNPWNTTCICGGSSDGSAAAVMADIGVASIGSDTGGSVRLPSALCGLVGIRPSIGSVSRYGVVPVSSLDTVGPMTRTVRDCAIVAQTIAGYDPKDGQSLDGAAPNYLATLDLVPAGLRMGVPREFFFDGLDPEVEDSLGQALAVLEEASAQPVDVSIAGVERGAWATRIINLHEGAPFHAQWLLERPDDYSEPLRHHLDESASITPKDIDKAYAIRLQIAQAFAAALQQCDFIVTPTVPFPAPRASDGDAGGTTLSDSDALDAIAKFTRPVSLAGLPCLTVPCGFTQDGLPVAFQLVGRPHDEARLFAVAQAYERATEWHLRKPPLDLDPDPPIRTG